MQLISVLGNMRYCSERRKRVVETKMLCLDRVEFIKYWQMKIIATVLSSFYFAVLLGISLSIWINRELQLKQQVQRLIEKLKLNPASPLSKKEW
jgi:ABC-type proline/glycine betaine transport system permease subunit